ncbi:2137_t:CDS:1, partial [Dentiscutata heterogama]
YSQLRLKYGQIADKINTQSSRDTITMSYLHNDDRYKDCDKSDYKSMVFTTNLTSGVLILDNEQFTRILTENKFNNDIIKKLSLDENLWNPSMDYWNEIKNIVNPKAKKGSFLFIV